MQWELKMYALFSEILFILMKFSFLLHLMLIVLELIPFKFDDLSTQIWWILFKILNSLMCAIANFHLKVRLLWNFHRIYQDVQLYYLFPFPFHTLWFFFFFLGVNDLNLCSRLHCTVVDYKYFFTWVASGLWLSQLGIMILVPLWHSSLCPFSFSSSAYPGPCALHWLLFQRNG